MKLTRRGEVPGNKKAHPIDQMSFKYDDSIYEALNLTYLSRHSCRDGIGTLSEDRLSRLHWAITLSLS